MIKIEAIPTCNYMAVRMWATSFLRDSSWDEIAEYNEAELPNVCLIEMMEATDEMFLVSEKGKTLGFFGVSKHGHYSNFWCKSAEFLDAEPRQTVRLTRFVSQWVYDKYGPFYSVVKDTERNQLFCRAGSMKLREWREDGRLVYTRDE